MHLVSTVSLTPDLSRALRAANTPKPFQRFSSNLIEAVETALMSLGVQHSWLKPDVNDIAILLASHSL